MNFLMPFVRIYPNMILLDFKISILFKKIAQASICLSTNDSETYSINSLNYTANSFSSPNSPTSIAVLNPSNNTIPTTNNMKSIQNTEKFKQQTSCSSAPLMNKNSVDFTTQNSLDIAENLITKKQKSFDLTNSSKGKEIDLKNSNLETKKNNHDIIINKLLESSHSLKNKQSNESSRIDTLIMVVHGGIYFLFFGKIYF
jgi:hypothetical protein